MSYVLLSGATCMLGAVILKQLLAEDKKVNTVVRSFAKSKAAISAQYPSAVQSGQLIFTEIPDMGVSGVFDEPLRHASDFIHAATPLGTKDFYETIIKPVSIITENVLISASKASQLKRLVITGSIVSNFKIPDELMSGRTISEKDFGSVTLEEGKSNLGYAYSYSKVTSEKEAWAFMEKNKPKFELVYLLAPSITGKNIQVGWKPAKGHLGGASGLYKSLFDVEKPEAVFPYFMDVEDVAKTHIMALSPAIPGNERYLYHARGEMFADSMANFIREKYPQLKSRVPAGATGNVALPPNFIKTNISKFEKVFGTEWRGWEESLTDVVEDILKFDD